jgi:hypothetical protein
VSATVLNQSPTSEWITIAVFNPIDGQPLVGNASADWNFTVDDLTMTGPALFDNSFAQWFVGTVPAPTQNSFGGFINDGNVNPVSGIGPGYGGSGFTPGPAQSSFSFDPVVFVDPYSFITAGGIPVTADGFEELLHFTSANPVPEPSTWAMMLLGFGGLSFAGWRSRKTTAHAA